ncbi:hypothetical protein BJY00DRAFT_313061 [Aspergillus carlsbadensis]|nr:hypothetical protein BJY00DRAFT_313061 [Aspergillus carlsbadensis]
MIGIQDPDNFEDEIERLGQLVAVDVLTGDILVDVLVTPNGPVRDYRTAYSGLTKESFVEAREKRKLVKRVDLARQRLFKWIDKDTILVGHALQNDFRALRITHNGEGAPSRANVIDTQIVARKEVERMIADQPEWKSGKPPNGRTKLKQLTEALCGETIQADLIKGHDCVEDAYATREVLLSMERSRSKTLEDWAKDRGNTDTDMPPSEEIEIEHIAQVILVDVLTKETLPDIAIHEPAGTKIVDWRTRHNSLSATAKAPLRPPGEALPDHHLGDCANRPVSWIARRSSSATTGEMISRNWGSSHVAVVDTRVKIVRAVEKSQRLSASVWNHDCVEVAFAAREVILRALDDEEGFAAWAETVAGKRDPNASRKTRYDDGDEEYP